MLNETHVFDAMMPFEGVARVGRSTTFTCSKLLSRGATYTPRQYCDGPHGECRTVYDIGYEPTYSADYRAIDYEHCLLAMQGTQVAYRTKCDAVTGRCKINGLPSSVSGAIQEPIGDGAGEQALADLVALRTRLRCGSNAYFVEEGTWFNDTFGNDSRANSCDWQRGICLADRAAGTSTRDCAAESASCQSALYSECEDEVLAEFGLGALDERTFGYGRVAHPLRAGSGGPQLTYSVLSTWIPGVYSGISGDLLFHYNDDALYGSGDIAFTYGQRDYIGGRDKMRCSQFMPDVHYHFGKCPIRRNEEVPCNGAGTCGHHVNLLGQSFAAPPDSGDVECHPDLAAFWQGMAWDQYGVTTAERAAAGLAVLQGRRTVGTTWPVDTAVASDYTPITQFECQFAFEDKALWDYVADPSAAFDAAGALLDTALGSIGIGSLFGGSGFPIDIDCQVVVKNLDPVTNRLVPIPTRRAMKCNRELDGSAIPGKVPARIITQFYDSEGQAVASGWQRLTGADADYFSFVPSPGTLYEARSLNEQIYVPSLLQPCNSSSRMLLLGEDPQPADGLWLFGPGSQNVADLTATCDELVRYLIANATASSTNATTQVPAQILGAAIGTSEVNQTLIYEWIARCSNYTGYGDAAWEWKRPMAYDDAEDQFVPAEEDIAAAGNCCADGTEYNLNAALEWIRFKNIDYLSTAVAGSGQRIGITRKAVKSINFINYGLETGMDGIANAICEPECVTLTFDECLTNLLCGDCVSLGNCNLFAQQPLDANGDPKIDKDTGKPVYESPFVSVEYIGRQWKRICVENTTEGGYVVHTNCTTEPFQQVFDKVRMCVDTKCSSTVNLAKGIADLVIASKAFTLLGQRAGTAATAGAQVAAIYYASAKTTEVIEFMCQLASGFGLLSNDKCVERAWNKVNNYDVPGCIAWRPVQRSYNIRFDPFRQQTVGCSWGGVVGGQVMEMEVAIGPETDSFCHAQVDDTQNACECLPCFQGYDCRRMRMGFRSGAPRQCSKWWWGAMMMGVIPVANYTDAQAEAVLNPELVEAVGRKACGNGRWDWPTLTCVCDPGWTTDNTFQFDYTINALEYERCIIPVCERALVAALNTSTGTLFHPVGAEPCLNDLVVDNTNEWTTASYAGVPFSYNTLTGEMVGTNLTALLAGVGTGSASIVEGGTELRLYSECNDFTKGRCVPDTQACSCTPGYVGRHCMQTRNQHSCWTANPATRGCSGHGTCLGCGVCKCSEDERGGWRGAFCETPYLNYECVNGWVGELGPDYGVPKCICNEGWTGLHCNISRCPYANGLMCNGKSDVCRFYKPPGAVKGWWSCRNYPQGAVGCTDRRPRCKTASGSVDYRWGGCACEHDLYEQCGGRPVCSGALDANCPNIDVCNEDRTAERFGEYRCQCPNGFTGTYCGTKTCTGGGLVSSQCNLHGDCSGDTCTCYTRGSDLYKGVACHIKVTDYCGTIQGSEYTICAGRGQCVNDTAICGEGVPWCCSCDAGLTNINSRCEPSLCSYQCYRGTCSGFGVCNCPELLGFNAETGDCDIDKCTLAVPDAKVDASGTACYCANDARYQFVNGCQPPSTGATVNASALNGTAAGEAYDAWNNSVANASSETNSTDPLPKPIFSCPYSDSGQLCGDAHVTDLRVTANGRIGWDGGLSNTTYKTCEPYGRGCVCGKGYWKDRRGLCQSVCHVNNTAVVVIRDDTNITTDVECRCNIGFNGSQCEDSLCHNGGELDVSGMSCTCPLGWSPPTCRVRSCVNGGVWDERSLRCVCPTGWAGDVCDVRMCQNGFPVDATTGQCKCKFPFFGESCEYHSCDDGIPDTVIGICKCFTNPPLDIHCSTSFCPGKSYRDIYGNCQCAKTAQGTYCNETLCGDYGAYVSSLNTCLCRGLWVRNPLDNNKCTAHKCGARGYPQGSSFACVCNTGYVDNAGNDPNARCALPCRNGTYSAANDMCLCWHNYEGPLCDLYIGPPAGPEFDPIVNINTTIEERMEPVVTAPPEPAPEPAPAVIEPVKRRLMVTLNQNYDALPARFEDTFARTLSAATGIPVWRIRVLRVSRGSVVVDYEISDTGASGETSVETVVDELALLAAGTGEYCDTFPLAYDPGTGTTCTPAVVAEATPTPTPTTNTTSSSSSSTAIWEDPILWSSVGGVIAAALLGYAIFLCVAKPTTATPVANMQAMPIATAVPAPQGVPMRAPYTYTRLT